MNEILFMQEIKSIRILKLLNLQFFSPVNRQQTAFSTYIIRLGECFNKLKRKLFDGEEKHCVDFRKLNKISKFAAF